MGKVLRFIAVIIVNNIIMPKDEDSVDIGEVHFCNKDHTQSTFHE